MLLPPKKGLCQVCAVEHPPEDPRNAESLYYAIRFKMLHGRDVTWADAVAHCGEAMRAFWERELRRSGSWTEAAVPIAEWGNVASQPLAMVDPKKGAKP